MIDRQSIETTIQQVADGEISIQQATQQLLASDGAEIAATETPQEDLRETEFESLTCLIKRLGDPPNDIIDHWCQQLRESLQSSPQPIDRFDLADFEVTSNGQIRFAEASAQETNDESLSSGQIDAFISEVQQRIVQSGNSVTLQDSGDQAFSDASQSNLGVVDEATSPQHSASQRGLVASSTTDNPKLKSSRSTSSNSEQPVTHPSENSWWPKVTMVAGIALCGGALLWIVRANSTITVAESNTDQQDSPSTSPASGNVFTEFPTTRPRPNSGGNQGFVGNELFDAIDSSLAGPNPSSSSLQNLQSLEQTSDEEIAMLESDAAPNFSLEDLIPSIPQPAADIQENSNTDSPTQSQSTVEPSDGQDATLPSDVILSDDSLDADQPDELQQPTRSVISTSIKLPPMEQTDPVTIDDQFPIASTPEKLTLAFPHSVDLSIQPGGDDRVWTIVEEKRSKVIANVDAAKNNLSFAWAAGAAKTTGSRSLHHGRITSGDGSAFFLRPQIEAKPWPIRLDQPDMRPTWDLGSPLPPGVTRLSVEVNLPESLEMAWVQPIPVDSPRRARGLAIVKPLDGESVDLAVKFDVRCSRKLSCRLRFAARLDSSMPWQLVSRDLLELFANQLAGRAELVSREADRLQNVYDMAGTRGKRIIRVKQKYNDQLAESLRQYADRVAELESLIADVESNVTLSFRLWVLWPSGTEQTVFASVDDRE